jgi:hypothetical protein
MQRSVTGRALKVTIVLDAGEILAHPLPETGRLVLRIRASDRTMTADIAAKSLRKAQATLQQVGAQGVTVILQGKLGAGDAVIEAGLTAQPKVKPSPETQAVSA